MGVYDPTMVMTPVQMQYSSCLPCFCWLFLMNLVSSLLWCADLYSGLAFFYLALELFSWQAYGRKSLQIFRLVLVRDFVNKW